MQRFGDKAGMSGLDKEKIDKIIEENTSLNYEGYSKKRMERIEARIAHNNVMLKSFTAEQISEAEKEIDAYVELLENERDLSRFAVHIDMDAFFAAVEMRDDPSLRDIPMAVGGDSMLSTSNYVARRFGVRSAMPGFIARKLCPELKIVPCNFHKYKETSRLVMEVLEEYDPNFCKASLDEAYLDITDYLTKRKSPAQHVRIRYMGDCSCQLPLVPAEERLNLKNVRATEEKCDKCSKTRIIVQDHVTFGTGVDEVVEEMRFRIEQATGLTCSAGIGPNSMIAKISSDMKKPNGQFRVPNNKQAVMDFMNDLPIRKVNGIGSVTETLLKGLGINTCGNLYEKRAILSLLFSQKTSEHFISIALGISSSFSTLSSSEKEYRRKSISNERTFYSTSDLRKLQQVMKELCDQLIEELPRHGIVGGYSATCKMKFATFDLITRCTTLDTLIVDSGRLYNICERSIKEELKDPNKQLRLLGVQLSKLVFFGEKAPPQPSRTITSYFQSMKSDKESVSTADSYINKDMLPCCSSVDDDFSPYDSSFSSGEINPCGGEAGSECEYTCPICGIKLPLEISLINRHVDECLNQEAILKVQDELKQAALPETSLSHSNNSRKRKQEGSSKKVAKRSVKKSENITNFLTKL